MLITFLLPYPWQGGRDLRVCQLNKDFFVNLTNSILSRVGEIHGGEVRAGVLLQHPDRKDPVGRAQGFLPRWIHIDLFDVKQFGIGWFGIKSKGSTCVHIGFGEIMN